MLDYVTLDPSKGSGVKRASQNIKDKRAVPESQSLHAQTPALTQPLFVRPETLPLMPLDLELKLFYYHQPFKFLIYRFINQVYSQLARNPPPSGFSSQVSDWQSAVRLLSLPGI